MDSTEQTAVELMEVLGLTPASVANISRANATITLTNAQARRLLVLARKGKDAS